MSAPKRVELTFLGQALALRTDASPDYVRKLAKFVEERVAELRRAGVKDPLKALSLAALDITDELFKARDRKSTRLNSSHSQISYAVFCLKKKNKQRNYRFSSRSATAIYTDEYDADD